MRQRPKQDRSRILVDAIVEATARLLPDYGVRRTTTNRIAHVAGVSIGSLYRYFPDRDAILARLIQRGLERDARQFEDWIEQLRHEPLATLVHALVDRFTERYRADRPFLQLVLLHAGRLGEVPRVRAVRAGVTAKLAEIIAAHFPSASRDASQRAAFVVVASVMGVYQDWVLAKDEARIDKEVLNRELRDLVLSYLHNAESLRAATTDAESVPYAHPEIR